MNFSKSKNNFTCFDENKLDNPINLCDSKGNLIPNSVGWSSKPIHNCNIKGHCFRKKKFTYWNINNDKYLFNITITDFDYIGLVSIYLLNFESKTIIENSFKIPLAIGYTLPDKVNDDIFFHNKTLSIKICTSDNITNFNIKSNNFDNHSFSALFQVNHPLHHETLNVVIPWGIKRFHFTSKQNCLPTSGKICLDHETIHFYSSNTFASMDFGRGVWPYYSFWNWCSFSGKTKNNKSIGINLGSGWTDNTGLTENALLIDGKIIKIKDSVIFSYDKTNLMKPWHIQTLTTNSINLRFLPFIEKKSINNFVLIKSNFYQLFGYFYGTIINDDNHCINIDRIFGTVEEHTAKW
ncbi:DUF2804 domain-containing protein [Haloimpatiens sp. FM7330]|uniref:DUF2804 domain-containing protein n=1 Tax=Haloimpatiens sp. FM7330 TaxID=3298610 RepID=UPI00364086EF